jgi:hypothetical protein
MRWFLRGVGEAWTAAEREDEVADVGAIMNNVEARGFAAEGATRGRIDRAVRAHRHYRVKKRILALAVAVIAASSAASVYVNNRALDAVRVAALASVAPLALLFTLQRPAKPDLPPILAAQERPSLDR